MELEDAPGYIVFAGYYGTDEDKDGNRLVHFEYRRHHFAIEDASKALKEFKKNVVNDINKNL